MLLKLVEYVLLHQLPLLYMLFKTFQTIACASSAKLWPQQASITECVGLNEIVMPQKH